MPAQTASIALQLESKDFATKANDASTAMLGLQLASGAASYAFKGLGAVARTSIAEVALGAVAVDKFNNSLGKAATTSGKLSGIFGELSNLAYNTALVTTAVTGLATAYSQLNRIPQTLATISASGVNTQTIQEFEQMRAALIGNQEAVEGFVNTAISRLGQFEQAAARSATILKSNTRFDEAGNALRVNKDETLANAVSIQNLVNSKLDNAVTSTSAILAQYEVLSSGFAKQADSEKVLETALKLTQIGQAGGVASNAGDNAKLLGKSLQAYTLGAGDAGRVGAILNGIVENGITTIPELSNGFGAAGSSAAKAGISMAALGAGVAQLTSLGQGTDEALTGLKGLADTIVSKTPEANAELAKLSLNGQRIRFDIAEVQAKGLVQALLDVNKAAGNSPQILAKIFPDSVTSRAVTGLITGDGAGLKVKYDAINRATAQSLDDVAKLASDSRVNNMEKLANKFGEIVISIAQSIAPVVEPGLDALKRVADGFNAIPEPIKKMLGGWIAIQITTQSTTAALGTLVKTLGDLAGIYAVGRVLGLVMTGQLGAELTVIKELVVQRKGLMSVLLQTIGINQRYRLGVDAASAALVNQGVVARGVGAAAAKGAEAAGAASNKLKDIFARNVAGARAAAAEFGATPAAGKVVNAGTSAVDKVKGVANAVANSQTGQNVRGAVDGFLDRNPAIKTAADELKGVGVAAIDKIKDVGSKAIGESGKVKNAAAATIKANDPYQIPDPWADASEKIGNAIGDGVNKARSIATDISAKAKSKIISASRLEQITNAELKLKSPKLLADYNKINTEFQATQKELASREKSYETRAKELERKQNNFADRAQKLEEIKDKLSPETYQKSITKLNKDAGSIDVLGSTVANSKKELLEYRNKAALQEKQSSLAGNLLNEHIDNANVKFAPLVAAETKLAKLDEIAKKTADRATLLSEYATNLGKIDPNSAEAIAAKGSAGKETSRSERIADRANQVREQYQSLLDSTGARTSLLAEQGLKGVRFGGQNIVYDANSKLQSLLYADVGKVASNAVGNTFNAFKRLIEGGVSGAMSFLAVNASRAALALGNLAKGRFFEGIGNVFGGLKTGLMALPSRIATAVSSAFASGGVRGVIAGGFNAGITGTGALATRLLPFLTPALVAAAAPIVAALGTAAIIFRDDYTRNKLAGEFRDSVDGTLKKDRELKDKFEGRNRPFVELKSAVENLSQGKEVGKFTAQTQGRIIIPSESSVFSNIVDSPSRLGGVIIGTGGKIGAKVDQLVQPEFKPELASALISVDPIRDQLQLLAKSGELTTEQFKDLDDTLAKMGKSGKISAEELAKFAAKIDGIKNQEAPQARGVYDTIGNAIYMAPGQLFRSSTGAVASTFDGIANALGALASGTFSLEKSAANREADALISYIGIEDKSKGSLIKLIEGTSEANVATRLDMTAYRNGTALDAKNIDKMTSGAELTAPDIERERIVTDSQIERNKAMTAKYDADIKNLEEQLKNQKDPGNKELLQNSINAYKSQKTALDKNTEALSASAQAFAKYHLETLPGINRALKETNDPTKAVGLAAEDFTNIYQKDSEGLQTKYIKDIAKLRDDAGKYIEALTTKYSIDNGVGAESEAVAGLKAARDSRITTSTGESGFRQTVTQRLALTDEIVKIQGAETQKIIAAKSLQMDNLKALTSAGIIGEREAQIESQNLSLEVTREKLAAKEKEIKEYQGYHRKTIQLEQEAAVIRIQIEQQVAEQQKAIRERGFGLLQSGFDTQIDKLKTASARSQIIGADASQKSSAIELAKTKALLDKSYADRSRLTVKSPELDVQISKIEQQYLQQQAERDKAARERKFSINQSRFDLESELIKTSQAYLEIGGVDALEKMNAIELAKSKAALDKLYADRSRLTVKSPELNQQIFREEERYDQQQANAQTQIFEAQLALKKQLIGLDSTRATQPLSIQNKQIESAQKVGELQSNILSTNQSLLNSSIDIQQAQLGNEGKLSNSIIGRANIELASAKLKLGNLGAIQSYERQSLILQQELTKLSLTAQQNQLNISRIEQQRTIKELGLQQLKLNRDKSNSPEIRAQKEEIALQVQSAQIQLRSLNNQSQVLDKQVEINKKVADAKLNQNAATNANARETERINVLLAGINVKASKITYETERQNLAFTSQTQELTRRSNIFDTQSKQLENQSKILTTQKGLISASADSRIGELGVMDNLTTIESVKLNIAQQIATTKLASLTSQIQYEKDILELNIKQQQATLEQDKLKQKISVAQAQRDILGSRSSLAKLELSPTATAEDKQAARLDLQSKEDNLALVRTQGQFLVQQGQMLDYTQKVQQIQLDYTQKGQLQNAIADVGRNSSITPKAYIENNLMNAISRQEGTEFYKAWADSMVGAAKLNPIVLPQFNSPFNSQPQYYRSGVGSLDFGVREPAIPKPVKLPNFPRNPDGSLDIGGGFIIDGRQSLGNPITAPQLQSVDYSNFQRDAQARYQEFVNNPIKVEISPQVQREVQGRTQQRERGEAPKPDSKPPQINNIHMSNQIKISVADGKETKDSIVNMSLDSLETVLRLVKERN